MKRKSTLFFHYNICPIIDIMIMNKYKKEEGVLYISFFLWNLQAIQSLHCLVIFLLINFIFCSQAEI